MRCRQSRDGGGYSLGSWVDDYTFVAHTNGFLDDRTWLDNAGLPQSDHMTEVEETYHRVDADHLELSVKITDPKMYTETVGCPRQVVLEAAVTQLRYSGDGVFSVRSEALLRVLWRSDRRRSVAVALVLEVTRSDGRTKP